MGGKLTKRGLRAMRDRWEEDLARIEALVGITADAIDGISSADETVRNLASAIANIDGIITNRELFPDRSRTALHEVPHE